MYWHRRLNFCREEVPFAPSKRSGNSDSHSWTVEPGFAVYTWRHFQFCHFFLLSLYRIVNWTGKKITVSTVLMAPEWCLGCVAVLGKIPIHSSGAKISPNGLNRIIKFFLVIKTNCVYQASYFVQRLICNNWGMRGSTQSRKNQKTGSYTYCLWFSYIKTPAVFTALNSSHGLLHP